MELETAFTLSGMTATFWGVIYFSFSLGFLVEIVCVRAYTCVSKRDRIKRKRKRPNSVQKLLAQRPGRDLQGKARK